MGRFSPGVRKAAGNTGWLFFDRIFRLGIGVAVYVVVARYLGPELFGEFNFAIALVALFTGLSTLGLDNLVVRFLVDMPGRSGSILGTAILLRLGGSILTCATVVLVGRIMRPGQSVMAWLIMLNAIGLLPQVLNIIEQYFQAYVASKYAIIGKNIAFGLAAAVRLLLVYYHASVTAFAWAILLEYLLGAFALLIVYRWKRFEISRWNFNVKLAKELLKESWPLTLSGMVIMIYMRLDQIMLGQMRGDHAVGIYSAAVRFSEVWYFIPTAIVNTVFPTIVRSKDISQELYLRRNQLLFEVMALCAYLVAIPLTFLSRPMVSFALGAQYIGSAAILSIHVWTGLFVFLGIAAGPWILTERLTKFSFATTAIGAAVNFALNLFLIPRLGGIGAAISTVIAQLFAAYLANAFYSRTRDLFMLQTRAFALPTIRNMLFHQPPSN